MRPLKFKVWDGDKFISLGEADERGLVSYQIPGKPGDEIESEYDFVHICLSAGLYDKNGKEIYDGDLLLDELGRQWGRLS